MLNTGARSVLKRFMRVPTYQLTFERTQTQIRRNGVRKEPITIFITAKCVSFDTTSTTFAFYVT